MSSSDTNKVQCPLCEKYFIELTRHLRSHRMTTAEFKEKFPDYALRPTADKKPNQNHLKYTDEQLREAVEKSTSVRGTLRTLGASQHLHRHISQRIKKLQIDTSHFSLINPNKRLPAKLTPDKILVYGRQKDVREDRKILLRALLEKGVPYKCSECTNPPVWNKKELVLQIDHINGDILDNRIENLRFLCPNCHSQTETYGNNIDKEEYINTCLICNGTIEIPSRTGTCLTCLQENPLHALSILTKRKKAKYARKYARKDYNGSTIKCTKCDAVITKDSKTGLCMICSGKDRRKVPRPSKEELEQELRGKVNWLALGRKYRVAGNTVRGWARSYGLL